METNEPKKHVHAELILEWTKHVVSGEVDIGWWRLEHKGKSGFWVPHTSPFWSAACEFRIVKTDKHPENQAPKLKLVDWSKMPVGTMTNKGEVVQTNDGCSGAGILIKDGGFIKFLGC